MPLLLPCEYQRRGGQPAPLLPELSATLAASTSAAAQDHGNALIVHQRALSNTTGGAQPRAPPAQAVPSARLTVSRLQAVASCSGAQPAGSSANGRAGRKKNYQAHRATYYVCTACGWSGSSKGRHSSARVDCNFTPCSMWYYPGDDRKARMRDASRWAGGWRPRWPLRQLAARLARRAPRLSQPLLSLSALGSSQAWLAFSRLAPRCLPLAAAHILPSPAGHAASSSP